MKQFSTPVLRKPLQIVWPENSLTFSQTLMPLRMSLAFSDLAGCWKTSCKWIYRVKRKNDIEAIKFSLPGSMKSLIHSPNCPPLSCQAALSLTHPRLPLTSDKMERRQSKAEFKGYHVQWIISNKKHTDIQCTKNGIMEITYLMLLG